MILIYLLCIKVHLFRLSISINAPYGFMLFTFPFTIIPWLRLLSDMLNLWYITCDFSFVSFVIYLLYYFFLIFATLEFLLMLNISILRIFKLFTSIFPILVLWSAFTLFPTASHILLTCLFFPSCIVISSLVRFFSSSTFKILTLAGFVIPISYVYSCF